MLINVAADEVQQHVSHVLALGGRHRLKAIVKLDGYVQVHTFDFLVVYSDRLTHLLSSEVSLSGYEYGAPVKGAPIG